jgi:prepilin-type N-terminal cleavage/methylation domain-containing protein
MPKYHGQSGLTLFELLISISILSIVIFTVPQVIGTAVSIYGNTISEHELRTQACHALQRMIMFVQATDKIDDAKDKKLKVTERIIDTHDNATHTYMIDGDGFLDADYDADLLVNEGSGDDRESVTFEYDDDTGLLTMVLPDYNTADDNDYKPAIVLCKHVTLFKCQKLGSKVVEIQLTLDNGLHQVNLKTRVLAHLVP